MSKVLILLFLLLPFAAICKDKHKPLKIPVGRWREVKRMNFDSTVKTFADTLFISFRRKDSFTYHFQDGFVYNGGYTIDEDSLMDFGTTKFKIAVKRPGAMVLLDDKNIYVMGIDLSDTAKIDIIGKEDSVLPVKSIEQIIGHWTVYKKETEKTAESIDFSTEIKAVYITGPSTDGKQGFVYGGLDPNNYPSWYIKGLTTDQSLDCAGKSSRMIKLVKCQKGEMILDSEGIKYFLKQFK